MSAPDHKIEEADAPEASELEAEGKPEAEAPRASIEDVASRMGWSPKDKWRGAPEKWKPADEFVISTAEVNRSLARDLKATKESVDRISRTSAQIAEREIERRLAELNARHDAAIDAGDKESAKRLGVEIAKTQAAPVQPAADPVRAFRERNAWYGKDPEASDLAYKTAEMAAREGANHAEQMQQAEEVVRKRYPALFGEAEKPSKPEPEPAPKAPAAVNAPASRQGSKASQKRGVADLPPEAKRAMGDFVRRGRCSEEEYAEMYWKESA